MITYIENIDFFWREIGADIAWLYARHGVWKKYAKQIKSKQVKENTVLGWSTYTTPSYNTVHRCVIKRVYSGVPALGYVFLFEYKGGYFQPAFSTEKTILGGIYYTAHSIERVKERMGVDFIQALEEHAVKSGVSVADYSANGHKGTEGSMWFGNGFFICNMNDFGYWTAITYIDKSQAHSNQLEIMLQAKRSADACFEQNRENHEERTKHLPRRIRREIARNYQ